LKKEEKDKENRKEARKDDLLNAMPIMMVGEQ